MTSTSMLPAESDTDIDHDEVHHLADLEFMGGHAATLRTLISGLPVMSKCGILKPADPAWSRKPRCKRCEEAGRG